MITDLRSPAHRPTLLRELKHRIDARAYVVDPVQVAEAVLRHGVLGPISPGGARIRSA